MVDWDLGRLMSSRINYKACPLCRSGNIAPIGTADCSKHPLYVPAIPAEITWCRCAQCEHVFTEGYFTPDVATEVFAKSNPHQRVGANLENQRPISARMIEKVLAFMDEGDWLDVGFGNGSLLFTAEEYGFSPVGIDLRPENVAMLQEFGIEAHCLDVAELGCPERFSVVSMADVLEHMPFPVESLTAVRRLLRPGGILLLSMPNSDSALWKALEKNKSNPYWAELEHYHNFGRARLYRLLRDTGFEPSRYGISERYRVCTEIIARKR
jgi:SAM-dependent methyltransferase